MSRDKDPGQSISEKINSLIDDGGGCAEAWEATNNLRNQDEGTRNAREAVINRRTVLRSIGIGVSGTAMTGIVASDGRSKPIEQLKSDRDRFRSQPKAREAFEDYAIPVIEELTQSGLITSDYIPTIDDIAPMEMDQYLAANEGTYVHRDIIKGTPTVRIEYKRELENGHVSFFVHPHLEEAYGAVAKNGKAHVITPSGVVASNCVVGAACRDMINGDELLQIYCCVDNTCRWGSHKDSTCRTNCPAYYDCCQYCPIGQGGCQPQC